MDLQEAFDAGFEAVKAYVDDAFTAFEKRLKAIEDRQASAPEMTVEMVKEAVSEVVAALPKPKDGEPGKDADPESIRSMVAEAIAEIPRPADGKDADPETIRQMVAEAVAELPPPAPGKDADPIDPEAVKAMVAEIVEPALAALPVPQDGKSVTVEDVEPLITERVSSAVSEAVKAIPVPKDGKDGLDAVTPILKDGVLLFTMSDGSVKEVGRVSGKDGEDGAPGKDGRDGFGFEDLNLEETEKGLMLTFRRGEEVKSFRLPVVIDRGVWSEEREGGYLKGDAVTWAGSVWISQKDANTDKPDSGDGWRLSVKRGRDGKPGRDGELKAKQPVKVG